jgi:outer membrane protein
MSKSMRAVGLWMAMGLVAGAAPVASAAVLTADQAVQIALKQSTAAINSASRVTDAQGGLYGAYSGILPHVSAGVSRSNSVTAGLDPARPVLLPQGLYFITGSESHGTTPGLTGSWSVLDLSNIESFSSARNSLRAARHREASSRNDIAFLTRRQFYEVVKAVRLADVSTQALRLSRDDERRVRALFEVGSVSRSDLLRAQVRTSQSQLDSLTASYQVVVQRTQLATQLGLEEARMGEVDTVLTVVPREYDEATLLKEAASNRRDLMAAEAEVHAAGAAKWSARLMRAPYLAVTGNYDFNVTSRQTGTVESPGNPPLGFGANSSTDHSSSIQLSLNWDFIDGLAADSRNAAATAQLARATAARDEIRRNLASDVHQALIAYRAAIVGAEVAQRANDSAEESVKLTQQKYNVGSATILDLIDAQVQLQRTQSDQVSAGAAIRVAEAKLDNVRGKQE